MGRTITTAEPVSQGALQSELDARLVDSAHQGRLDTTVSSRAPAATALSNSVWTNARAANLDKLDVAVSSRLNLSGLQGELNTRGLDATHMNRLDTTVSSRLSSGDAILDLLRRPAWIHGSGWAPFKVSGTGSGISATRDLSTVVYSSPTGVTTYGVVYSRTGRGAVTHLGAAILEPAGGSQFGLRLELDGVAVWESIFTVPNDSFRYYVFAAPIGSIYYNPNIREVRFTSAVYPNKYVSSVVVKAFSTSSASMSIYYKELRY